jgi:hypothetical protein
MRKIYSLIFLAIFLAAGQAIAQKQLYFGGGGTGISSWLINQNNYGYQDLDVKAGISYGFNANAGFDFNNNLGVKLELGFQKLGQKYSKTKADTNFTRNIGLNYFQLPLLFKFRTGGETVKFMAAIGPQFDFLMNAKQDYYYTLMDSIGDYDYTKPIPGTSELISENDITHRFNSFDIQARLDLGVEIIIIKNLFIDAGFSFAYGLKDIIAPDYQFEDVDGNYNPVHNAYVGFNVGINYCLNLSKSK